MAKVFLIFALFFIVVISYLLAVACSLIGLILDLYPKINSEEREKREKEKWEKEEKKWSEAEEREKEERRRREAEEKRKKAEKEQRKAEEKRNREEEAREKEKYKDYRYCILVLLAKIMKADGDTMECELDRVKSTIRRYYKTKEEQYEAFNTFKSILDDNNYFSIWSSLNTQFDYTAKSELIMELLAVAYSDNNLKYAEEKEILHIVSQLRITSDEYKSIYSIFIEKYNKGFYSENKSQNENRKDHYYKKQEEHRNSKQGKTNNEDSHDSRQISSKEKNAYAILGVESNATDEEIKKAYRAMAIKCHPDNASNLGDEAIRQATESMKQINMAWETVKMARGIK